MKWEKIVTLYGVHCEGEVGRVITGGIINIPGKTMLDKMVYINTKDDWVRRFTLYEPRGSAQMSVNILIPPVNKEADAGFIVLQPDQAHALSGSNTMCVTTALLETGILSMKEPQTNLTLETAAGLIPVVADCKDGKAEAVQVDICPSFAEHLDKKITVEGLGEVTVDVGFGGCYFVLCDVNQLGIKIRPKYSRELVELGKMIKEAAGEQIQVQHPDVKEFNQIEYVMFTDKHEKEENVYKNATIIYPGRVDRSPCGTGTASRMAIMYEKGELKEGETIYTESIIGGRFEDKIAKVTKMDDGRTAVIPRLKGRSWIYAIEHFGIDPTDPYPTGYVMADTWGPEIKED